jgi:membrane protease subunit HflK
VVTQAQGDAERFKQVYAEYSKAPAVIRQRMYLDTMQQIYSRTTKVFVDGKGGNNVLYLPLDKLADASRQRAGEAAGTAPASGAAATPGATEAQQARAASAAAASAVAAAPASAASGASQGAAGDPSRSRDAFRSRTRQDDLQ